MPLELASATASDHGTLPAADRQVPSVRSADESSSEAIRVAVRDGAVRATTAVGLGAIAVIHVLDSVGKWTETRYLFWIYMALVAGCIVTAGAVLFHRSRAALLAAAVLAGCVIVSFVLNRTVGLPDATGDIGNWLEPLGLASLAVESCVVAIGLAGYRAAR